MAGPAVTLAALAVLLLTTLAPARAIAPALACGRAAIMVAAETGVPADILGALTLTETGRRRDGVVQPWAWSVNAEGTGTWFEDPVRALAFAEERVAQGRRNLDIGCFQINYRWHGQHFGSVAEMFDPVQNARYAAHFLTQLYTETGDWRAAAGAFHSRRPGDASKYLQRFDELRAGLQQRGWQGLTGGAATYNRFADEGGGTRDRRTRVRVAAGPTGPETDTDPAPLATGVEVPVPDMSRMGAPLDVSLEGGSADVGGGAPLIVRTGEDAMAPGGLRIFETGIQIGHRAAYPTNGAASRRVAAAPADGWSPPLLPGEDPAQRSSNGDAAGHRLQAPADWPPAGDAPASDQSVNGAWAEGALIDMAAEPGPAPSDAWAPLDLRAAEEALSGGRRTSGPRMLLLGAPVGTERSGMAGSLAVLADARGPLLRSGRRLQDGGGQITANASP